MFSSMENFVSLCRHSSCKKKMPSNYFIDYTNEGDTVTKPKSKTNKTIFSWFSFSHFSLNIVAIRRISFLVLKIFRRTIEILIFVGRIDWNTMFVEYFFWFLRLDFIFYKRFAPTFPLNFRRVHVGFLYSSFLSNEIDWLVISFEGFWSTIATRPITRIYSSDFRPNLIIESLFLRLAENWQVENFVFVRSMNRFEFRQAFWLCYILSMIPRRTHLGYIYRTPDVFNSSLCILLIINVLLQSLSQLNLTPEISCGSLAASLVFLLLACRLLAVKLVKFEEKYRSLGLSVSLTKIDGDRIRTFSFFF